MPADSNRSPHRTVITVITAYSLIGAVLAAKADNHFSHVGEIISLGAAPFTDSLEEMERRDAARLAGCEDGIEQVRCHVRPVEPRFLQDSATDNPPVAPSGRDASQLDLFTSLATQAIGATFTGITLQDQFTAFGSGSIPPDTMGAIGPSNFVEVINSSVAIYTRTGTRIIHVSLDSAFFVSIGGVDYPRNGAFDPRVIFDRRSNRWFSCALERGASASDNHLILAVSRGPEITNLSDVDKYVIAIGEPAVGGTTFFSDFPALGVDDNGVYFGVTIFPSTAPSFAKIIATPKASLVAASPSLSTVTQFSNITDLYSTPQPAHNHNAVASDGRAWFVAASDTALANIHYRSLTWIGGTPVLSGASSILTTPLYGAPINAPALGSTTNINVTDDRMQMAVIRNNRLWTCRHIGVNSGGGPATPDRTGCEWYEINAANPTATLIQSGRVFDNAASDPRFYYFPSIMVNGQGHAAMGFSASKSTERVHAFSCGRLVGDQVGRMGMVSTIKEGLGPYQRLDGSGRNRWGDYSYTSLDPNDDMSIWTIQEFADTGPNIWGTWIAQLLAPPPATPSTCNPPSLTKGTANAELVVTATSTAGSGFFDPGAGFANRPTSSIDGSGVVINSVLINNPTQLTMNVTVPATATIGSHTISVTNPDGQTATSSTMIFEVLCSLTPPAITQQPASAIICSDQSNLFCVTANGSGFSYQWQRDGSDISGATSSCFAATQAGSYRCVVTDGCVTVTSDSATLTVNPAPIITQSPTPAVICSGQTHEFCVTANGNGVSYQWQRDGSNISGATSSCYTATQAGSYRCVVTDGCGSVTSDSATLTINTAPSITQSPASAIICPGQTHPFCVTASGNGLGYQWQRDGSNISGATSSCYTATQAGSYRCVVSNDCGSVTSDSASLSINTAPSITQPPVSQTVCFDGTVTFEVTVQSPTPVTYQWRKDSVAIGGATGRALVLNAVEEQNAGLYDVVVTNECAETSTSTAATLAVTRPKIIGQPEALLSQTCDTITFSVVADPAPFSYQWRRDGLPLMDDDRFTGSQTNKLSISPLARSDYGTYDVVVMTGCGEIISSPKVLTIQGNTNPNDCPQASALEIGGVPCAQCGVGASFTLVFSMAGLGLWRRRSRTRGVRRL